MKKFFFSAFLIMSFFVVGAAQAAQMQQFPYRKVIQDASGIFTEEFIWPQGESPDSVTVEFPLGLECQKSFHGELAFYKKGYWGTILCTPPAKDLFLTDERCDKFRQNERRPDNASCHRTEDGVFFRLKCNDNMVLDTDKNICVPTSIAVIQKDLATLRTENIHHPAGLFEYYKTLPASHNCKISENDEIECSLPVTRFYSKKRCETYVRIRLQTSPEYASCGEADADGLSELKCVNGTVWDANNNICAPKKVNLVLNDLSGSTTEERSYFTELQEYFQTFPTSYRCTIKNDKEIECRLSDIWFYSKARCEKHLQSTHIPFASCSETGADGLAELKCETGTVWNSNEKACVSKRITVVQNDLSGSTTEKRSYLTDLQEYFKTLPASHHCTIKNDKEIECSLSATQFYSKSRCGNYIWKSAMTSENASCSDEDENGISVLICKKGFPLNARKDIAENVCGVPFKVLEKDLWGEDGNSTAVYLGERYTDDPDYDIDRVVSQIRYGRPKKYKMEEKCVRADTGNVYIRCSVSGDAFYTKDRCDAYIRANNIEAECHDIRNKDDELLSVKAVCKEGYRPQTTDTSLTCIPETEP